ncbi:hypothetical protein HDV05_008631, partial [Chytridiales sp. JEL 0842]
MKSQPPLTLEPITRFICLVPACRVRFFGTKKGWEDHVRTVHKLKARWNRVREVVVPAGVEVSRFLEIIYDEIMGQRMVALQNVTEAGGETGLEEMVGNLVISSQQVVGEAAEEAAEGVGEVEVEEGGGAFVKEAEGGEEVIEETRKAADGMDEEEAAATAAVEPSETAIFKPATVKIAAEPTTAEPTVPAVAQVAAAEITTAESIAPSTAQAAVPNTLLTFSSMVIALPVMPTLYNRIWRVFVQVSADGPRIPGTIEFWKAVPVKEITIVNQQRLLLKPDNANHRTSTAPASMLDEFFNIPAISKNLYYATIRTVDGQIIGQHQVNERTIAKHFLGDFTVMVVGFSDGYCGVGNGAYNLDEERNRIHQTESFLSRHWRGFRFPHSPNRSIVDLDPFERGLCFQEVFQRANAAGFHTYSLTSSTTSGDGRIIDFTMELLFDLTRMLTYATMPEERREKVLGVERELDLVDARMFGPNTTSLFRQPRQFGMAGRFLNSLQ